MHNARSMFLKRMIFDEQQRVLLESKRDVDDVAAGDLVSGVIWLRHFVCRVFEPVSFIWF